MKEGYCFPNITSADNPCRTGQPSWQPALQCASPVGNGGPQYPLAAPRYILLHGALCVSGDAMARPSHSTPSIFFK